MKLFPEREILSEIDACFAHFHGSALPIPENVSDRYQWLHELAPYAILAHDASSDPHFIYANHAALKYFNYTQQEFMALPSKLSAKEGGREERQRLLDDVTQHGIAYGYTGIRVDKMNQPFVIRDGIVWQLVPLPSTLNQAPWGQGALFYVDP